MQISCSLCTSHLKPPHPPPPPPAIRDWAGHSLFMQVKVSEVPGPRGQQWVMLFPALTVPHRHSTPIVCKTTLLLPSVTHGLKDIVASHEVKILIFELPANKLQRLLNAKWMSKLQQATNKVVLCTGQFQNRPPPPRANPRAFDFFEKFWLNSPLCCQFRRSNAPPVGAPKRVRSPTLQGKQNRLQNRLPLETSSAKFSATTNFLFSLSSLHALNKDIYHDIMCQSNRSLNIPFRAPPPPGHLNFWKIFVQIPHSRGWKVVQMPHHRSMPGDQMPPTPGNVSVASIMLRKLCM